MENNRKYIVFMNSNRNRARDSSIEKTFNELKISKEMFTNEFERKNLYLKVLLTSLTAIILFKK